MNRRTAGRLVGCMLVLAVAGQVAGQSSPVPSIVASVQDGDAPGLLQHASPRVEVAILGQGTLYSRAQATYVVVEFFRRYPPETFRLVDEARTDGSWFLTGRYEYGGKRPFRMYIRLRQQDGHWEVREIRVEERSNE